MSGLDAIAAVGVVPQTELATNNPVQVNQAISSQESFADMLSQGLEMVEVKIDQANQIAREFAVDDSIPIHQVTIALEEARLAVELAMQVRSRLVEGYREIMNMQM